MSHAVCVNNKSGSGKKTALTVGKSYDVLVNGDTTYEVINDAGNRSAYLKNHFNQLLPDGAVNLTPPPLVTTVEPGTVAGQSKDFDLVIAVPNGDTTYEVINIEGVFTDGTVEGVEQQLIEALVGEDFMDETRFTIYKMKEVETVEVRRSAKVNKV